MNFYVLAIYFLKRGARKSIFALLMVFAASITAVSYTHLDVYKRQVIHRVIAVDHLLKV